MKIKKHIDYIGKNKYSINSPHFLTKEQGQNAEYYLYALVSSFTKENEKKI